MIYLHYIVESGLPLILIKLMRLHKRRARFDRPTREKRRKRNERIIMYKNDLLNQKTTNIGLPMVLPQAIYLKAIYSRAGALCEGTNSAGDFIHSGILTKHGRIQIVQILCHGRLTFNGHGSYGHA